MEETGKYWLLSWGLILSLGIILCGVFRLSIIRKNYYTDLARNNKIFETIIPSGRGQILDRKGRVLAKSIYQYFKVENETKVYDQSGDFQGYKFEGKDLAYDLKRQYPYGESAAFVSGYVGKVSDEDIKKNKCNTGLDKADVIGRGGLEDYFDCELRGRDGKRLIEVDATGKYLRELGREEPELGDNVISSIDAFWQEKVYKILDKRKAVVVISEPSSGKIRVFVSSPAYDPNDFSYHKDNQAIKNYLEDREMYPMLNRISSARYHPGSVFKIVMATAGLESGVIDKDTTYEDTGVLKVGEYSYNNWLWTKKGQTDGMVNIVKGLMRSNDIYFYKLGENLGVERIKDWSNKLGYGEETGVELNGELSGIVPDEKWKLENKGEKWYLGNTYHLSIGQGDLSVTPLQVNQMTNVMANNGIKCDMSLIEDKKSNCVSLGIKRETLKTIIEGMKAACKPGGTAWPHFNFKTEIACKTGTAQVGDGSDDTHAWLTAFAPINDPQISITVMVEKGGEGSDVAAPIVGDILKEWFEEPETLVPRYDENKKVVYD